MTSSTTRRTLRSSAIVTALSAVVLGFGMVAVPSTAEAGKGKHWRGHHHHHHYYHAPPRHHRAGPPHRRYRGPRVVYAPPPVYYVPPPRVVYAPPPPPPPRRVYRPSGASISVTVPLR